MTKPGHACLPRSKLSSILEAERFGWATGIEDTFIADPWPATGRTLDEYELTGHYRRWRSDLALMAELGVGMARYGVPWYRVQPSARTWRWEWADRPLERMLELGIDPIVDLVHYGTPKWIEGGFLDATFPDRMAEYAARLAERYRGRIYWYTPFNEPRIAAWYAGRLGWWPPYRTGWRGFVAVLLQICRAVAKTDEALRAVDPDIVPVHVDATDLYIPDHPSVRAAAAHRQHIVFLALDLITGAVDAQHPLYAWLMEAGVSPHALEWFAEPRVKLDLLGINLYPMFTRKRVLRTERGAVRFRLESAGADLVARLARAYVQRYGAAVMITETAALGSVRRRIAWLEESVREVARLRARGVPVVGYTWWPMFSLVAWAYRQRSHEMARYLLRMGLWDLDPDANLTRRRTPVVDAYQAIIAGGAARVGAVRCADITTPGSALDFRMDSRIDARRQRSSRSMGRRSGMGR